MIKNRPELITKHVGRFDIPYLFYDCLRDQGQSLILLHGTGFPPHLWHPIAVQLSKDYRVAVPFYSDHIEPEAGKNAVSWMSLAEDLALFCRNLNIEKPFIVGHSMGASVATISEANCGLKAAAMVLIEPIFLIPELYGIPFTIKDHPFASKSIKRINGWHDEDELRNYLQSKALFQKWDHDILELYIQHGYEKAPDGRVRLVCSPQREAVLFMGGMMQNPWPLFTQVDCPVLVMEGEDSENRIYVQLESAASFVRQGAYRLIKRAGHLIPMEKPKEVTAVILDYFHSLR